MGVLRHRDFRLLFLGQSASAIGDQVVIVALALFITRRTGSATDLGIVLAAQSLPLVLLLLFGGVWADRLPRHLIMLVADALRALLHTTLAILILTNSVQIWEVVLIEAMFGAAQAFFQPAYTGLIPQTVPEDEIQAGRALTESSQNVALLIGAALATVLVLGVGASAAFFFDAGTFVVSALLLAAVRPRSRGIEPEVHESVVHALHEGWREVISRPWVWVTIVAFTGALMCAYAPWFALGPTVAREAYGHLGLFGVLQSLTGVGAIVGGLIGIRWKPTHPLATGLTLVLFWPIECILFAVAAPTLALGAVALATGFGFSLCMVWWETALANHIPPHALSRVSSYDWMGSLALLPVGYAVAGPLAGALGARTVLAAGGAISLVLVFASLLPRSTRELTELPIVPALAEQVPS